MALDRLLDHAGKIDGLAGDREARTSEPREVEQIGDQPLEPIGLGADDPRRLGRRDRLLLERLRVPADRGQRRPQLVADRLEEASLRLAGARELVGHLVERRPEVGQLVLAPDGHRHAGLARREAPGGRRQLADRAGEAPREQEREHHGEQDPAEAGEQQASHERPPLGERDVRADGSARSRRSASAAPRRSATGRRRRPSPGRRPSAGSAASTTAWRPRSEPARPAAPDPVDVVAGRQRPGRRHRRRRRGRPAPRARTAAAWRSGA